MIGQDEVAFTISKALLKKGIFVPTAAYPAVPRNKARLRFNVISEHSHDQILRVLDCLAETLDEAEAGWDVSAPTVGSA
jgi:7-keto-8-aminopelargonate synthetase-like enzyme